MICTRLSINKIIYYKDKEVYNMNDNLKKLSETRASLYNVIIRLMKLSKLKTLNDFYKFCKLSKKEQDYITLIAPMICLNQNPNELLYDAINNKEISFQDELNLIKRCTEKIGHKYNF